jgi:hypothetical protein
VSYDSDDKFTIHQGDLERSGKPNPANRVPAGHGWALSEDGTQMYVYDEEGKLVETRPVEPPEK